MLQFGFPVAFYSLSAIIASLLWLGLGALKVYALVHAVRRNPRSFVGASKQTKQLWLIFLGLALAFHLISGVLSIVNLAGDIAAIVYLVDVRPAVDAIEGRKRSSDGPYGPW